MFVAPEGHCLRSGQSGIRLISEVTVDRCGVVWSNVDFGNLTISDSASRTEIDFAWETWDSIE